MARRFPSAPTIPSRSRINPIIPYIEGDGIGIDISPVMKKVVDAAVDKAYGGQKQIQWMEVYAGEKSTRVYGEDVWLPRGDPGCGARVRGVHQGAADNPGRRRYPLPERGPAPSSWIFIVCLRPVRYFRGTPSPLKEPEHTDMVIFRENSEDIYAGVEWQAGTPEVRKVDRLPAERDGRDQDPLSRTSGIGVKPVSEEGPSGWCARRSSTPSTTAATP